MKIALTIAGSDSSAGAGIQADLKTFHAHGIYGVTAITAVTVQNTQKVFNIEQIRPSIVHDQIVCLFEDMDLHAVKIGMTADIDIIDSIAAALKKFALPPVVLDPVMISTSGYPLLTSGARKALIERLFPLADVITPNINEAEALIGETIPTVEAMKKAAVEIARLGARKVVLKGGHIDDSHATDILFDGKILREIKRKRIKTRNTHGTGCTFSSAIAANFACGHDFFAAVENAKTYITDALSHSISIGK
jgi:hydroxymethylpyrimidine/phosphomethylpyrimidine kinase